MPYKDYEKNLEYARKWRKEHPEKVKEFHLRHERLKQIRLQTDPEFRLLTSKNNSKAAKKWRSLHPDGQKEADRKHNRKIRLEAMVKISGNSVPKCRYCGCDFFDFLQINHINGGGYKEWKANGSHGSRKLIIGVIRGSRTTDDLEIACAVCNTHHYLKLKYGDEEAGRITVSWRG